MSSDRQRELRWSHLHYVEIIPRQPEAWDWFEDLIVGLSDFLALLMWQPIYPRSVIGLGPEVQEGETEGERITERESTEVFWHFLKPQVEPSIMESNILMRMGAMQLQFPSVLNAWFLNRQRLEPVYELFFGSLYAGKIHVAFQFHAMTRALEGLHRVILGGQYHPDLEYDWYKEELKQCVTRLPADNDWKNKFINGELRYSNQYSQRKRFKDLLNGLDSTLRSFLVHDTEAFVSRIVDTRNYLTHLDQRSRANSLQGGDLVWGFYKLQILVGVFLLRSAGFSDGDILRALSQNVPIRNRLDFARHHVRI